MGFKISLIESVKKKKCVHHRSDWLNGAS